MGDGRFKWPSAFALAFVFAQACGVAAAHPTDKTTRTRDDMVQVGFDNTGAVNDGAVGNAGTNTETVARAAGRSESQAQAYTDNALPAQTAAAPNPIDARAAVNGWETANVIADGNLAITPNAVTWYLRYGWAVAANSGGNYSATSPHYGRPFGPASSGQHTGLTVNPDTVTNTGGGFNFGEGDTANSAATGSVPTAA